VAEDTRAAEETVTVRALIDIASISLLVFVVSVSMLVAASDDTQQAQP
jgi:hypothetical protein